MTDSSFFPNGCQGRRTAAVLRRRRRARYVSIKPQGRACDDDLDVMIQMHEAKLLSRDLTKRQVGALQARNGDLQREFQPAGGRQCATARRWHDHDWPVAATLTSRIISPVDAASPDQKG